MNCPVCTSPLAETTYESTPLASCPGGHGAFLTSDSLFAVIESREDDKSEADENAAVAAEHPVALKDIAEQQRACPVCAAAMSKLNYAYESGVIVDTCSAHGMWVDAGELDRMQSWVEGSEKQHDREAAGWHDKLDVVEQDFDRKMAAQNRSSGRMASKAGLSGAVERISLWWYQRDDHARR